MAGLEQEIARQEGAIKVLRSQSSASNPEALAAQLSETRTRLANLQSRIQELDQLDQTLVDLNPEHFKGEVPEVIHDRILTSISRQVATGDAAARTALAERVSELIAQNARERAELDHQSRTLSQLVTTLESEFEKNARVTAELRQIERDVRATQLLHETFLSRLKEAAVQQGAQTPDSRIVSAATPGKQVAPRSGLIMFLGMIAGAALGPGIVLARQIRQSAVPTRSDLELATSVPVLGHLPLAPILQRSQLAGYLSTNPTSPLSEAARNLRTSLLSPTADAPPQVILCTSSVPDEGKTTMTIALAQSLAGLGRSVLLVEADIRSLSFRAYFPDNPNGGLVTALSEGKPLCNLLRSDTRLSVDVLMGERSTRNAADIFSSLRFHDLMKRLRADYDNILIDSPPVLAVPDARVIGQACDTILLSVAPAITSRAQLAQALREFSSVNLQVNGLVLSDLGFARKHTKAGGQAYGAYAHYYNV